MVKHPSLTLLMVGALVIALGSLFILHNANTDIQASQIATTNNNPTININRCISLSQQVKNINLALKGIASKSGKNLEAEKKQLQLQLDLYTRAQLTQCHPKPSQSSIPN